MNGVDTKHRVTQRIQINIKLAYYLVDIVSVPLKNKQTRNHRSPIYTSLQAFWEQPGEREDEAKRVLNSAHVYVIETEDNA